jgi:hypothetical protein
MANDDYWRLPASLGIPEEISNLFGRVPVLSSQSKRCYWSLVKSIADPIGPRDAIEWLCVKDLVDLTWNKFFYRGVEAGIIDVTRMQAVISILGSILPDPSSKDWAADREGEITLGTKRSSPWLCQRRGRWDEAVGGG